MDSNFISIERFRNIAGYINQTGLVNLLLANNSFSEDDIHMPEDSSVIDTWLTFSDIDTYIREDGIEKITNAEYAVIHSEYGVWLGMTYASGVDNTISKLAELLFEIDLTDEELQKLKTNDKVVEYRVFR